MITFLRLAGLGTAAVWLGGTVFHVLGIDTLFGGVEIVRLLGPVHATETGFVAAQRFHLFQVICASLALIHLLAEWLYTGKSLDRRLLILLVLLLTIGSFGRLYVVPKCRKLNLEAHVANGRVLPRAITPVQRQAEASLGVWQGIGILLNIVSLGGVTTYFFQSVSPGNGGPRWTPKARMRI